MKIIKIGGGETINLESIVEFIKHLCEPIVVVLGANHLRNALAQKLGIRPKVLQSLSGVSSVYTDEKMLELIHATYSGIRRNQFVSLCQAKGVNALGLSGIDGGLIKGRKNKGIRINENGKKKVIRDLSGRPQKINVSLLESLLAMGYTPVITIPILDEEGFPLNSENDDIVSILANVLDADQVVHFIEAEGLLNTDGQLMKEIGREQLENLTESLGGRIKRKLMSLLKIIQNGAVVRILDGRMSDIITAYNSGKGKTITTITVGEKDNTLLDETETMVLTAKKSEIYLERASGVYVYDQDGKRYLDCSGGWGVALIGHRNSEVSSAIVRQLNQITIAPSNHRNSLREKFTNYLLSLMPQPLNRVFLSNSGTEAIEAALKFAICTTGRDKIVSHIKGFHGRTLGSLSVTHNRLYRRPFESLLNHDKVEFIPLNDLKAAEEVVTEETAAVIVEVIQGEGGVHEASDDYLKGLRKICNQTGALLIIDEVQTGVGRTGDLFAFERSGIVPDILCLAKGLGGGFPIGATIVSEKIEVPYGIHGSTFGGNPIACATGLATLQTIIDNELVENARTKGELIRKRLIEITNNISMVREIRGRGLMIAIELKKSHKLLVELLKSEGILTIPTGRNVIRLLPPLVITSEDIDRIIEAFKEVFLKLNKVVAIL